MSSLFDDEYYGKLFGKKTPSQGKKSSSTKTRPGASKKPSLAHSKPAHSRTSPSSRLTGKPANKLGSKVGGKKPHVSPSRLGMGKGISGWEDLTKDYQQPGSNIIPYEESSPWEEGAADGVPGPIVPESGEELVSQEEGIPEEALDELSGQAVSEMGFGEEDEDVDPIESEPTDYDEENYGATRFDARQLPVLSRRAQDMMRRREAQEGHVFVSMAPPSYGADQASSKVKDVAPSPSPFMEGFVAGAGAGVGFLAVFIGIGMVGRALQGK